MEHRANLSSTRNYFMGQKTNKKHKQKQKVTTNFCNIYYYQDLVGSVRAWGGNSCTGPRCRRIAADRFVIYCCLFLSPRRDEKLSRDQIQSKTYGPKHVCRSTSRRRAIFCAHFSPKTAGCPVRRKMSGNGGAAWINFAGNVRKGVGTAGDVEKIQTSHSGGFSDQREEKGDADSWSATSAGEFLSFSVSRRVRLHKLKIDIKCIHFPYKHRI